VIVFVYDVLICKSNLFIHDLPHARTTEK